uniref:Amino acid permease/ SLC12A domain-containing protein n=1 Tax=Romanomermis culicivorax TaxID=13658 RepID=A0A915HZX2_ROMCU
MFRFSGAPRLLQAIASDGVIPLLAPLQKTTKRGEPLMAILLTVFICELGILIAALESITALISQVRSGSLSEGLFQFQTRSDTDHDLDPDSDPNADRNPDFNPDSDRNPDSPIPILSRSLSQS